MSLKIVCLGCNVKYFVILFPKGADFVKITDEKVAEVESIIKNPVASAFVALHP